MSIGNINSGETENIYNDNTSDQFNTEMDGVTVTLTFLAPVNPGVPNTLKVGVADVGDSNYDTNLLIAGGSVQSTIIAQDDAFKIGLNSGKTIDVLANDTSTGGTLTVTHINGTAIVAGQTVTLATGQQITLNPDGTLDVVGDGDTESMYFNYTIEDLAGNTDTAIVEVNQIPCFASGTQIETPDGAVCIENLCAGMSVMTRDEGAQIIRWIGQRTVDATGPYTPIRLRKGQYCAQSDFLLSPQHRVLIAHSWAQLLSDEDEVLVKVKDFVNDCTVRPEINMRQVTYFHILLDQRGILSANGVTCESYLPGPCTMSSFDAETQQEILHLFPELRDMHKGYGPAARAMLKTREARILHDVICRQ